MHPSTTLPAFSALFRPKAKSLLSAARSLSFERHLGAGFRGRSSRGETLRASGKPPGRWHFDPRLAERRYVQQGCHTAGVGGKRFAPKSWRILQRLWFHTGGLLARLSKNHRYFISALGPMRQGTDHSPLSARSRLLLHQRLLHGSEPPRSSVPKMHPFCPNIAKLGESRSNLFSCKETAVSINFHAQQSP